MVRGMAGKLKGETNFRNQVLKQTSEICPPSLSLSHSRSPSLSLPLSSKTALFSYKSSFEAALGLYSTSAERECFFTSGLPLRLPLTGFCLALFRLKSTPQPVTVAREIPYSHWPAWTIRPCLECWIPGWLTSTQITRTDCGGRSIQRKIQMLSQIKRAMDTAWIWHAKTTS